MHGFKRVLLGFFALAMLVGCFSACGKKTEDPVIVTDAPGTEDSGEEKNGWSNVYDDVPQSLTFGEGDNRREFVMLIRSEEPYCTEFDVFEDSSLVLNKAVFERNMAVEKRLGVMLRMDAQPGNFQNATKFNQLISNSVKGDTMAWHVVAAYAGGGITSLSMQSSLHNLKEVQHLDFTKSYWNQSVSEQFTINDRLYF